MATLKNTTFTDIKLPTGNSTTDRPGSPVEGMTRFNNVMNLLEFWDGTNWRPVTGYSKGIMGTGGDSIRWVGASGGRTSGGIVHMFTTVTSTASFTPNFTGTVEVLVIGGGGSGGGHWGGGGGGGGMIYNRAFPVTNGTAISSITVGTGAAAAIYGPVGGGPGSQGKTGGNSVFSTLTANGGGGGGSWNNSRAQSGGSGGGSGTSGDGTAEQDNRFRQQGGTGTTGQGYSGGSGIRFNVQGDNTHSAGGAGGAGGPGWSGAENAYDGHVAHGGPGAASDILGHMLYWGGGGGGAQHLGNGITSASGGIGGGGGAGMHHGGPRHPTPAKLDGVGGGMALNNGGACTGSHTPGNGGTNTGGGAGGHNWNGPDGQNGIGGPGIVVIRY